MQVYFYKYYSFMFVFLFLFFFLFMFVLVLVRFLVTIPENVFSRLKSNCKICVYVSSVITLSVITFFSYLNTVISVNFDEL